MLHYSIVNQPYKSGDPATWNGQCNKSVVDMYKVVVEDLWDLGISRAATVFFGVSAGVLSTMVLLTSMLEDTTLPTWSSIGVFIAGAWHANAHHCFAKAVVHSDCRVLVVNHRKDSLCLWREQEAF